MMILQRWREFCLSCSPPLEFVVRVLQGIPFNRATINPLLLTYPPKANVPLGHPAINNRLTDELKGFDRCLSWNGVCVLIELFCSGELFCGNPHCLGDNRPS